MVPKDDPKRYKLFPTEGGEFVRYLVPEREVANFVSNAALVELIKPLLGDDQPETMNEFVLTAVAIMQNLPEVQKRILTLRQVGLFLHWMVRKGYIAPTSKSIRKHRDAVRAKAEARGQKPPTGRDLHSMIVLNEMMTGNDRILLYSMMMAFSDVMESGPDEAGEQAERAVAETVEQTE